MTAVLYPPPPYPSPAVRGVDQKLASSRFIESFVRRLQAPPQIIANDGSGPMDTALDQADSAVQPNSRAIGVP